jgi:predicted ArsR family transcriptional regulator
LKANERAIYYFIKLENRINPDKWFNVREIAKQIDLSIHRTRRHLTCLVLKDKLETKINNVWNVYKVRK